MRKLLLIICVGCTNWRACLLWCFHGRTSSLVAKESLSALHPLIQETRFEVTLFGSRYLMNQSARYLYQGSLAESDTKPGQVVYAILEERPGGVYERSHYSSELPDNEVFIKGRFASERGWARGWNQPDTAYVKYGIEQMFVEQGKGIQIEERQGLRGSMQTAMEVELAIGADGTAILVGHQWADFAIAVEIELPTTASIEAESATEALPIISVTIQNVSDSAQALVDSDDQCSFSLQLVRRNEKKYRPTHGDCMPIDFKSSISYVLQPGEQHQLDLDLDSARWHITQTDIDGVESSGDIRLIAGNEQFRIVYATPSDLINAELDIPVPVWQGELISQSFDAFRVVD